MALDTSAAAWLFKTMYADGIPDDLLVRKNPLLAMTPNETDFTSSKGKSVPSPYVNPQGGATTYATAASNESSSKGVEFTVPQRTYVWHCKIDAVVVKNAQRGGDASAVADALEREVNGATEAIGQELNRQGYGDVTGVRSFVHASTAPSTTTLTLANPEDAQLYEVGMALQFVDGSNNLRASGAQIIVTGVDAVAGTLTAATNWTTTITGLAVGDGILRSGDRNAVADGLKGWVPTTVSGADSFNGVNRSVHRTRLAGVYSDLSAYNIRQAFLRMMAIGRAQAGAVFEKGPIYLNPKNMYQLQSAVEGNRLVSTELPTTYGVGVHAFEVDGHKFIEDPHCPVDEFFMIGDGAWTRGSCGKQPSIDDMDELQFRFDTATGKLSFTLSHDGNFYSYKTAALFRGKLQAVAV